MTEDLKTALKNKTVRKYLPADLVFEWPVLEKYFVELRDRAVSSAAELLQWLRDVNELDAAMDEELAWRYIRSTCDTTNAEYEKAYDFFVTEIEPKASPFHNELNKKLDSSPYRDALDPETYSIYLRTVRSAIKLFREQNIPLLTQIDQLQQRYGRIAGEMMVTVDGKELTLQQAANFLKSIDRAKREEVYRKIWERRLADHEKLDSLFDELCVLRHKVALNAGFTNFRDYAFEDLGRFDYTVKDCFNFHDAVAKEVVPFIGEIEQRRKQRLGVDHLRPWDLDVDISGKPALKPFATGEELIEKTVECFRRLRPMYAGFILRMKELGHFDLDSRKGKAPGGYNYSLAETGVPFIFMNAAASQRDLVTMVHEGGHAVHSFLENDLPLNALKSPPSEVCELASMGMELISMEHWDVFYSDPEELKRAKREQLEKILDVLPWVATVDAFQHWIYENNGHTVDQRCDAWKHTRARFESNVVDWSGLEEIGKFSWHKQLHIFEVPFYYIEYGMAQLGAIALWRNFRTDPEKALNGYEAALKLGYTRSIGKIYEAAGIKFDFSAPYVRELVQFVKEELAKLN